MAINRRQLRFRVHFCRTSFVNILKSRNRTTRRQSISILRKLIKIINIDRHVYTPNKKTICITLHLRLNKKRLSRNWRLNIIIFWNLRGTICRLILIKCLIQLVWLVYFRTCFVWNLVVVEYLIQIILIVWFVIKLVLICV